MTNGKRDRIRLVHRVSPNQSGDASKLRDGLKGEEEGEGEGEGGFGVWGWVGGEGMPWNFIMQQFINFGASFI